MALRSYTKTKAQTSDYSPKEFIELDRAYSPLKKPKQANLWDSVGEGYGIFNNDFQCIFSKDSLGEFSDFFNKPDFESKPSGGDFSLNFSSFFNTKEDLKNETLCAMNEDMTKITNSLQVEQPKDLKDDGFKFPKPSKIQERIPEPRFSLKRDSAVRLETKKPQLDISSPAPSLKPNLFMSGKKPSIRSTPSNTLSSTKSIPSEDTSNNSNLFSEEIKHIEDLRKTIDSIEDLKNEDFYSNLTELVHLKKNLPRLIQDALKIRTKQVVLLNKLLTSEVPELQEVSDVLKNFDSNVK